MLLRAGVVTTTCNYEIYFAGIEKFGCGINAVVEIEIMVARRGNWRGGEKESHAVVRDIIDVVEGASGSISNNEKVTAQDYKEQD